jgi:hypothetical protein
MHKTLRPGLASGEYQFTSRDSCKGYMVISGRTVIKDCNTTYFILTTIETGKYAFALHLVQNDHSFGKMANIM